MSIRFHQRGAQPCRGSQVFWCWRQNSLHVGKERREQEHIERKKRVVKNRKIPLEELKTFVEAHPDAFLREIAAHFDCAVPSVWAALKQIKVTLKKDDEL